MNVCIMGASLETGNRGVSALAASLAGLVRKARPDARISFFIGARSSRPQELRMHGQVIRIEVINFRLSPRASMKEHLFWMLLMACLWRVAPFAAVRDYIVRANPRVKGLLDCDLVGDIRGGDSFSDTYGFRRFLIGSLPALIILVLKKRLVLLPQTYGPYRSFPARHLARLIMAGSESIMSRDEDSIDVVLKSLGEKAGSKPVQFCPDVAFTLDTVMPSRMEIRPAMEQDPASPVIGLNVNGLMYNGGYNRANMFGLGFDYRAFITELVNSLMERTDAHVLLLPHTYGNEGGVNSDPKACLEVLKSVAGRHGRRIHMVAREYDQYEIKGIIGTCDFFIGSRMHACIAALSQGIPTVCVAYSKKFKGVFDSVGAGDGVIDARTSDLESAVEAVLARYHGRAQGRKGAGERMDLVKGAVFSRFRELLEVDASPAGLKENAGGMFRGHAGYAKN